MTDYGILASRDGEELTKLVNEAIKDGYTPLGGVQVVNHIHFDTQESETIFYQSVMKHNLYELRAQPGFYAHSESRGV